MTTSGSSGITASVSNFLNRSLWTGRDNLEVMRGMNSNTVDLIYADPPFNSKKTYSAPIGSKAAGAIFKDFWTFDDVDRVWLALLRKTEPAIQRLIDAVRMVHSPSMAAYLGMMAQRVAEMKRLLRPNGSIFLHCDHAAGPYLKLLLDAIFGAAQFRNELVWAYAPSGRMPRANFPRKHDTIWFYAAGGRNTWNPQYSEMNERTLATYNLLDTDGRKYKRSPGGRRSYLDQQKGRPVPSWWTDIPSFGTATNSAERTGYPTQKPLALLRRIIRAGSNAGDVVLDPFCGCATTCVAAEELGRQWVGIDISHKAAELVRSRLQRASDKHGGIRPSLDAVIHRKDIPRRTDMGKLLRYTAHKDALYGSSGGYCGGCGEHFLKRNLTVDHVVPRSKGGTDHPENLWLLCQACNSSKGTRSQSEFLRERMSLQGVDLRWLELEADA